MDFKSILPDISSWKRINDHYTIQKREGMPKVSIIIPSCNDGHLIEATIQSFILQKNVDKELIIVDADSEDHTGAIIEKYKDHIARVYYVTQDNVALMINKGFALATGEYISFILPGIFFLNQYSLSHVSRLALEDLRPDIIFTGTYLSWPDFKKIKDAIQKPLDEVETEFIYFPFNKTWLKRGFFPTAPFSIWINKNYIKKIGLINYRYKILRKCMYDYLCRIAKDKEVKITSTFWSSTYSDVLMEKKYLNHRAVMSTWPLICKYFGIWSGLLWFFRAKPVNFVNATVSRVMSFFRE